LSEILQNQIDDLKKVISELREDLESMEQEREYMKNLMIDSTQEKTKAKHEVKVLLQ